MFEKELKVYRDNLNRWIEESRASKFVLIMEDKVIDFYDTYDAALSAGYRLFKSPPFFVRQISISENIQFITRLIQPSSLHY